MRLASNPFPRNLAGFVSCMAFALTALTGIQARGALTFDSDPNSNQALARCLSSGIVVDLTCDCHTMPVAGMENQDRPEVPYISPEDIDCAEAARATEPGDFSDTNAADDTDYMEYKYGHYGRNSSGDNYQNPTPAQSSGMSRDEYSTQADDPNNANLNSADNETAADENLSQLAADEESDADPAVTPGYEKYYRYRYMAPDEQVGRNEGDKAKDDDDDKTNPTEGVAKDDEGDDSQMSADDDTSDDMADDESDEDGAFTDAVLTISSQMADEWSGRYGMKVSDVARLMGWKN